MAGRYHPASSQSPLLLHDYERDPLTVASLTPVQIRSLMLQLAGRTRGWDTAEYTAN